MALFLSYASEDNDVAEQIHFALIGAGYDVFFDQTSLPSAGDYNSRIRIGIDKSNLLVFLISPDSVEKSSYALTELKFAQEKWPFPKNVVLPVVVRETEFNAIPNYLKAVTVLEPKGNIAAEVANEVSKIYGSNKKSLNKYLAITFGMAIVSAIAFFSYLNYQNMANHIRNFSFPWVSTEKKKLTLMKRHLIKIRATLFVINTILMLK